MTWIRIFCHFNSFARLWITDHPQPVSLNARAAELTLDRDISNMMLCHLLRNAVLMGVNSHCAFFVIHVLIVSAAHAKMSVFPVHGHTGSVHLGADVIALHLFKFVDQLRV